MAKRSAYVVLLTADPSHASQPLGAPEGEPTHGMTDPVGISTVVDPPRLLQEEAPFIFNSSVKLL
jgi:hypothetical protein